MTYSFTEKKRIRNIFGTRESILKEPDLLSIQINSFNTFIQESETEKKDVGLHGVFKSVFFIWSCQFKACPCCKSSFVETR